MLAKLDSVLNEVKEHYGSEKTRNVLVAWQLEDGKMRVSILPFGTPKQMINFIAVLHHYLENPEIAEESKVTRWQPP
jgi:predicted oxidoreductase